MNIRELSRHSSEDRRAFIKPAVLLSVAAHAALFAAFAVAFNWTTSSSEVYAELWAPEALPGNAPLTKPEPPAPTPAELKAREKAAADIALRQQEEARRKAEAEKQKAAEIEKQAREQKRQEIERKLAEQRRIEKQKAEELAKKKAAEKAAAEAKAREIERRKAAERAAREKKRLEELRKAEVARAMSSLKESAPGGRPDGDPTAEMRQLTGEALNRYAARVVACVRPNIAYDVPSSMKAGEHVAEVRVFLRNNGEFRSPPKMLKSSGIPAYDIAVTNAIHLCNPFPHGPNMKTPGTE